MVYGDAVNLHLHSSVYCPQPLQRGIQDSVVHRAAGDGSSSSEFSSYASSPFDRHDRKNVLSCAFLLSRYSM